MSADFTTFFVSGISYKPKRVVKKFSFEDFQKFQEIPAYCGLDLMILVL